MIMFYREGQGDVVKTRWDGTTVINASLLLRLPQVQEMLRTMAGIDFEGDSSMGCWSCRFKRDRKIKHDNGIAEHRLQPEDGFQGDPFLELWDEALDSYNYLDEIERRGYTIPPDCRAAVLRLAKFAATKE